MPPLEMTSPGVQRQVLDNGLTVIVQEVRTAPLVSVWCWYKVGSKNETAGLTGVSHWVEHMNFKGTTNIPREQMTGLVERFGGTWNGYTWVDQTTYLETATKDALDQLLFLEAERMANALYHPEECESERTVIISELQGGENDPEQLLDIELTAAALKAHPYRHPTIGWLADLQSMTRDDLYAYYRRYYVPNNATLVVVGDAEAADVVRRADEQFGRIHPATLPPLRHTEEPEQLGERRLTIQREGTTAYLKVAFHVPGVNHADFFPLLVLDAILTGAKGLNLWASFRGAPPQRKARLYRALVDRGLASSVSGAILPTEHPFLYTVSATAMEGVEPGLVEDVLLGELARVSAEGVSPQEVERARRQLRARMVFEGDSVTNIAHQLGFFETIGGSHVLASVESRIAAVTQADVNRVAAAYLKASSRTIGWFLPAPISSAADAGASSGRVS